MTSTIKADAIEAATGTNTDLTLTGKGSGVVNLESGSKLGGTALTSTFNPYVAPSTSGNVLTSNGSAWTSAAAGGGFTLGTPQATTSGTVWTFSSIPTGVSMIIMSFSNWSQGSAGQIIRITLGDAGGLETSGYLSTGAAIADQTIPGLTTRKTDSFHIGNGGNFDAADIVQGSAIFTLEDASAFNWVMNAQLSLSNTDSIFFGAGSKSLSAELNQISITTNTPGTGDSGSINIMYQ